MTDRLINELKAWSRDDIVPSDLQCLIIEAVQRLEDAADDKRLLATLWYGGRR